MKNRFFGKEAPRNSDAERVTIAKGQGASEHQNSGVYPKNLKSWPEARVKAPGIDDLKRVNINNMDPFAIVDSRELSRMPAANF